MVKFMRLLIDGYNLLHQSDLLGSTRGIDWLPKARRRLFLALEQHLPASVSRQVTVVFDRHSKKPIDADSQRASGIRVLFAVDYPEADDLIEVLIARHPQPKQLLVVSSDHRLQKAASRRKANFIDADAWYDKLVAGHLNQPIEEASPNEKPVTEVTDADVSEWLTKFAVNEHSENLNGPLPEAPSSREPSQTKNDASEKADLELEGYNPFPADYVDDLLDE